MLGAARPAAAQCPVQGSLIDLADPGTRYSTEGRSVSVPMVVLSAPAGAYPLAYSASGLPAGLSIDQGTGLISGTLAVGTAGTHPVTVTVTGSDSTTNCRAFEWKVSEWLEGDLFAGLADFSGNYNWWSRSGDLWKGQFLANPGYISAGCASDWRTGDLFTTDFGYAPATGAYRFSGVPAHDVITFFDSVFNSTTGEYRDTVPESVALANNGSVFIGHADGYFAQQIDPGTGDPVPDCVGVVDCVPSDANGFPLVRGFFFNPGSAAWEFDESYVEAGPSPGVPGALVLDASGNTLRYSAVAVGHYFVDSTGQPLPGADGSYLYAGKRNAAGLLYWHVELNPPYRDSIPISLLPAGTQLKPFYEKSPGQPVLGLLGALIPARLQDGRNLHVYRPDGLGGYVRTVYDTFYNAKGTDWIDLASDQRTVFYTSEYGIVHRYDTETGTQLPPFAVADESAMYALRLLPPGDGSGGLLAAAARHVVRLNRDGRLVQTYQGSRRCPDGLCRDMGHFALAIDPLGRTFWTGSLDMGEEVPPGSEIYPYNMGSMYRFDIASSVTLAGPVENGTPLAGMCVKLEYTAAQEVCNDVPAIDDDGDGLVNENCAPLEVCSPWSPGDDDGDGLIDLNDEDCGTSVRPAEECGDGIDNNGDARIDEGICARASVELAAVVGLYLGSNVPSETHHFEASGLPPGLVLDSASGAITGSAFCTAVTPPALTNAYTVNVVITNLSTGGSATGSFIWTVTQANCAPLVVDDAGYSTNEDTALEIAAVAGVLGNDVDIDGDTLSVASYTQPTNGSVTVNPDGSFSYQPEAEFLGVDTFTYTASDGFGGTGTGTVTITVAPVPDAPTAGDDSYTTNEDTPLTVPAPGVLSNDMDANGDVLTAIVVTGPAHGTLTLNADGSFTYEPDPDYYGTDSFTYQAKDGSSDSNVATVRLGITAVNDAPVAVPDSASTVEDTPVTFAVLGNDTDVDSATLSVASFSQPAHGTVTLNANGTFTYTPNAGYVGADSFTYAATDGSSSSNTTTVSLTVEPGNQAPVCDSATAKPATIWPPNHKFVSIGIKGVTDPDGDRVTIKVTSIFQDEPTNTDGDGNHTPDGKGVGTSKPSVRAERSGTKKTPGNGRVYTISFSATDRSGASCAGTVTVCVPHDQGGRSSCVDDGPLYDSMVTSPGLPTHDEDHCSVPDHDHTKRKGGKDDDKYRPWSWGFFHWSWR